jgi:hypothetical protein
MTLPARFESVEAVEDFMTTPSDALIAAVHRLLAHADDSRADGSRMGGNGSSDKKSGQKHQGGYSHHVSIAPTG